LFFVDAVQHGGANRIFKLELDNGRISSVTHPKRAEASDGEPSISPDGGEVLYNRDAGEVESKFIS
jgi:hypothetical protein